MGAPGQKARHGTLLQPASTPTVVSDPPCGLLERKDVDTMSPWPCSPRLGPRHKSEET
jgi:hypothetical protein